MLHNVIPFLLFRTAYWIFCDMIYSDIAVNVWVPLGFVYSIVEGFLTYNLHSEIASVMNYQNDTAEAI